MLERKSRSTSLTVGPRPRIAVDLAGSGPAVVFLHGVGGNRSNWRGQLAAFGDAYQAIAPDLRGYGESDDIEGKLEFADFAGDVLRVMNHLGVHAAHLVGLSMGGLVAQAVYARQPERVLSLTLASCRPGSAPNFPGERNAQFLAARLQPLIAGGPAALADALLPTLLGAEVRAEARAQIRESLLALRPEMYAKVLKARVALAPFLDLSTIKVPTLVLGGEQDRVVPPQQMRELAEALTGSRIAIAPHAGHLLNIEQPGFFNGELASFLGALQGASHPGTRNGIPA